MFQCEDCEFFQRGSDGEIMLSCDPFSSVKGPECLAKWQLLKLNEMADYYARTLDYHESLAPMQQKMFDAMEKEIDSMNESESWRFTADGDDDDDYESDYAEDYPGY